MLSRLSCASDALEDGDQVLGRLLRDRTGVGPVDASTVFDVILMDITMVRTNVSVTHTQFLHWHSDSCCPSSFAAIVICERVVSSIYSSAYLQYYIIYRYITI